MSDVELSLSRRDARQWERVELAFEAEGEYGNPFREVRLWVEFEGPDGRRRMVPGFWDGGKEWKVRFAGDVVGRWSWRSVCSVTGDAGLHDVEGVVAVEAWSEEEVEENVNRRGFVRVSESGRYFEYADGTPFYWLGDTLWAGFWKECKLESDFPKYIEDRKRKRFTVVQIVVGRPVGSVEGEVKGSYWSGEDGDFVNEGGAPYAERYDVINPEYFQYFDKRVEMLLAAGMVPCLFGGWGQDLKRVGVEHYIEFWEYIVARYAAYNVLWSIAGEYLFTNDVEGWRRIGQAVHELDPYEHPTSLHAIAPHSGSMNYQEDEWYDFNLIQVGHVYGLRQFMKSLPWADYQAKPVKPSVMSESWYENHEPDMREKMPRFTDRDMRFVSYVPLLQGCIGQTYGAHGIWSWASERDEKSERYNPPSRWQHDLDLPGSQQMKHLRDLMETVLWWELEPHPELVSTTGVAGVYCAAIPGQEYVVYVEGWQKVVNVFLPITGKSAQDHPFVGRWFNPRTGEWSEAEHHARWFGHWLWWSADVPDEEDWVLVVRKG